MTTARLSRFAIALVVLIAFDARAQTVRQASLNETLSPVRGPDGVITRRVLKYNVRIVLSERGDSSVVDKDTWRVSGSGKTLAVDSIGWRTFAPTIVRLYGPYEDQANLTVQFGGEEPILVAVDSAAVGKIQWGFGKGKALELNVRRLTSQASLLAFDYNLSAKILEHNLTVPNGALWVRSLSLDVVSNGTFGSKDTVRNGSQSSIQISAHPFYFVGGLIYTGQLSLAYQMETRMNASSNKLLDVVNHSLKLELQAEVPYSNYPMFALHSTTGYARLAMPLTLDAGYLPEGQDASGNSTSSRWDYGMRYELAFSPYLIVQGEWRGSRLGAPPPGLPRQTSYYSVAFAQDLDVVKKSLGFLTLILGDENTQGKHFVFYKISAGRKAPAFQDLKEQSIGFGTYF
jgi:hypothetical protein